jgi:hypothetical protein
MKDKENNDHMKNVMTQIRQIAETRPRASESRAELSASCDSQIMFS